MLEAVKFINFYANIKLESATMKSMSNMRWRKALNETPRVLEGSGLTTAPVDGTGR
ncbi:Hypothetical Protein SiL_0775 [Sulfolobus islandicus LAL14/1]|uniref:Uncharacterized protein n=1 Tax=Saccharolobus islandicus LAL14/1 TaxID=1241935 RepID=M9U820_SACIS|nr:Hypothetical Protein SiL_0364 [Sulfolobus islandicus LAL14/1]AGJ62233.1 Hypothetical Protein SiL_0775 [Sulfolobus islandicus LAL14/1]